jgi:hypothetical protein
LKFQECHLPTILVFIGSPAGRVVPEKLAYQEIAHQEIERSAADSELRETGPGVDRARIRHLTLPSSPPVLLMGLAALCIVDTSANSREFRVQNVFPRCVHKDAQPKNRCPLPLPG